MIRSGRGREAKGAADPFSRSRGESGKAAAPKLALGERSWAGLASCALLAAGTAAVYGRTFSVPLLLDDRTSIADNPSLRRIWPLWTALSPPNDVGVGGRPLLNLSYALNFAAGGAAVPGYHLANLLIHILAGWTLFALVRRTLRLPVMAERFGSAATPLALAVAAIWAWHPVQTESVTYLSERAESLMGLFYLLTIYCFVRSAEAEEATKRWRVPLATRSVSLPSGNGTDRVGSGTACPPKPGEGGRQRFVSASAWMVLSFLACLAGVGTKEVIVTAPLLVFLYDRTFISGSFSGAWRRHWALYLALAATWLPLGLLMGGLRQRGVGFGQGVAWWAYGLTECRAVVKYLSLAFWPHPLVFDRGMYEPAGLAEILPSGLVLVSLLAATIVALRRWPAAGFAFGWFLLILAPASSVIPIAAEPMAENRLYLSLAGVVAFVVLGAYAWVGRRSLPAFAIVAAGLGLASVQRNRAYSSEQAIWTDTVAKVPANPRAHNNLGEIWMRTPGRSNEAIVQFEEAIRLRPNYAEAHNNLGNAWANSPQRRSDAIAQFEEALRLKPDYAEAHYNLGNLWLKMPGRLEGAVAQYEEALRLKPDFVEAHNNLGSAWLKTPGRLNDAIAQFQEALRLRPDHAEAHYNLGNAWAKKPGRLNEAVAEYEKALRLRPDVAEVHFKLAAALLQLPGRGGEARAELEAVVRLQPGNAAAREILARMLAGQP